MLRKICGAALAVGLLLPYGTDARIITSVWHDPSAVLFQGVPVLITIAYVLHTFVPALAQFHEQHGKGLHGLFRMVVFVMAGAYLATALARAGETRPGPGAVIVALAITGTLLFWQQRRGTKAERLPLLMLICAGVRGSPTL